MKWKSSKNKNDYENLMQKSEFYAKEARLRARNSSKTIQKTAQIYLDAADRFEADAAKIVEKDAQIPTPNMPWDEPKKKISWTELLAEEEIPPKKKPQYAKGGYIQGPPITFKPGAFKPGDIAFTHVSFQTIAGAQYVVHDESDSYKVNWNTDISDV